MLEREHFPQIVLEANELVRHLAHFNVRARLFGSCAVWLLCEPARQMLEAVQRVPKDIDLVIEFNAIPEMITALASRGWINDEQLQVWSEGTRLRFMLPKYGQLIDVCVDRLRFAQTLDMRGRLAIHPKCITPIDLLLSKLQIVRKTRQDVIDIIAILSSIPVGFSESKELVRARPDDLRQSSWRWDVALHYAQAGCAGWKGSLGGSAFASVIDIAQERMAELFNQVNAPRHKLRWYVGAVRGKLTGNWFDEVEVP